MMAKRNDPVGRARGRKPAPIKKPFPLGFALGSAALVAALVAVLAYAFLNQGVGDTSSLKYAESAIDGLDSQPGLSRDHKPANANEPFQDLPYPNEDTTPPMGGVHGLDVQSCQVYTTPIASERALHALEHGAVWVTYNPDTLSKDDVAKLKSKVDGDPYQLMSPYPGLKTRISLQAWGEQLFVDSVSDKRIDLFLKLFTSGPQAPERGGSCQGTTEPRPAVAQSGSSPAAP